MRSVESSAKTMEEAISLGLEKLEASIADVTIDIVEEGTKGFLGIGSKPFVVRLTVREEENEADGLLSEVHLEDAVKAEEKAEKKPARKKQPKAENVEKTEKAEKPAKESKPKAEKKQPKTVEKQEEPANEQVVSEEVPETVMCDPATPEGKAQE